MLRWLFLFVVLLVASGCSQGRRGPELLTLVDVVPAEVHPGERLEILGVQLPSGEASARVVLEGTLRRPGREPLHGVELVVEGASLSRDRVGVVLTDDVLERFVGRGDEALHTTFEGTVAVEIPTPTGIPVFGTLQREIRIDVVPRPPRHAVAEARREEARQALAWLGLSIEGEASGTGVVVTSLQPEGPAARAGLAVGDRIERLDGLGVRDAGDLVPSPHARLPIVTYRRGDQALEVALETAGFRASSLRDLVPAFAILGTLALVIALRAARVMRFVSWAELRLVGQASPRAVRLGAARGWLAEALRSVLHEESDDRASHRSLAPYVIFVCVSATFGALPFAGSFGATQLDVATLLLASQTGLVLVAFATGAWSADRAWSLGRALRAGFRLLSVGLPSLLAVTCVVLRSGSVRATEVLAAQVGGGPAFLETGGWPWFWNAARNPLVFIVFAFAMVLTLVESDADARQPLDAARPRGLRPALFFLAEWTHVFVLAALGALLFFGGWAVPGIPADRQAGSLALTALGTAIYLAKAWSILFALVVARWTFPRVREGLLSRLVWARFVPVSLAVLGLAIAWERLRPDAALELLLAAVVLAVGTSFAALVGARIFRSLRNPRPRLHLNPFL